MWNPVIEENKAFLYLTRHFLKYGLPVPEIYLEDLSNNIYLLRDLGDTNLFSIILSGNEQKGFDQKLMDIFRTVLSHLVRFQVVAGRDVDYSYCYPSGIFNRQSMLFDLHYWKYYFLKPTGCYFNENLLEKDFEHLVEFLSGAGAEYFMYRDFQSRNILYHNNQLYYIDYQGGRRGPLQYDLVSFLFQAKAGIPPAIREELLYYYMELLGRHITFNRTSFIEHFKGFVLIRMLQVLGAYGFRGIIEGKPHFIQSIPYAIENLKWYLGNWRPPFQMDELNKVLHQIIVMDKYRIPRHDSGVLTVTIYSFSFKSGMPYDDTGNGGGFVFDCRALPNPGRMEELRYFSGKDQGIAGFMKQNKEVDDFMDHVIKITDISVQDYLARGFLNLMISFGCTGGQHRSVYCAERLKKYLETNYKNIRIALTHSEEQNWILKG